MLEHRLLPHLAFPQPHVGRRFPEEFLPEVLAVFKSSEASSCDYCKAPVAEGGLRVVAQRAGRVDVVCANCGGIAHLKFVSFALGRAAELARFLSPVVYPVVAGDQSEPS